jgi:hypothetical protein
MELIVVPLLTAFGATGAASAATALGTSGLFTALGGLGSVVSGVTSIFGGMQQQSMYQMQAQQAQMQAKQSQLKFFSDELKYRQQGVAVLDRTLATAATIAARAGAGSIDPFSGSAGALTTYAYGKGFGEFNFAQESAEMTRLQGEIALAGGAIQAGLYQMSGDQAAMAGYARGASSIFGGLYQASQIGGPSLLGPSNLSQYPVADVPLPPSRPAGI